MNRSIALTKAEYKGRWGTTFLWGAIFMLVAPALIIPLIVLFITLIFGPLPQSAFRGEGPFAVLLDYSTFPMMLITALLVTRYVSKRSMGSLGFFKERAVQRYGIGMLLGAGSLLCVFAVTFLTGNSTSHFNPAANGFMLLTLFAAFLVQGMTEEVIFRGFIMNAVAAKKGILFAVISNSLFFALFHAFNPGIYWLPLLNIFIFGIVFSLLFYLTDNMWLTGAAHSLWNYVMGCLLGIEVSGQTLPGSLLTTTLKPNLSLINGGVFGLEGGLIATAMGLLFIYLLYRAVIKKYGSLS